MPAGGITSEAKAVNSLGEACGIFTLPNPNGTGYIRHGFLWSNGTISDLGVLPGYLESYALDINVQHKIVGYCLGAGYPQAFIWQNGVMSNLNGLVPSGIDVNSIFAVAINDSGQIACQALNENSDQVAVLLTPIPSVPGDFNCDRVVNTADLLGVINHWGFPNSTADFNHDGIVNAADLMIVIQNWVQ